MKLSQKEINWLLEEKYPSVTSGQVRSKNSGVNPEFFRDIKRLKEGEPLDYVIGFVKFLDCKIDLSKKPLIPRPETEFWTEKVIQEIGTKKVKCLDIFAGSGCIGVAVLNKSKNVKLDFGEKEKKFCEQIKINVKINRINLKRYKIINSDIFGKINGKYDFIFANPPYVAEIKIKNVQKTVLKHEPKNAVFGGKDGFLYIKKFLFEAKNHLNPDGKIYMEIDSWQKLELEKILKKEKYENWEIRKDQFGKTRYVIIKTYGTR